MEYKGKFSYKHFQDRERGYEWHSCSKKKGYTHGSIHYHADVTEPDGVTRHFAITECFNCGAIGFFMENKDCKRKSCGRGNY